MTQQLYIKTDGPLPWGCDYITAGKVYELLGTIDRRHRGSDFVDDKGRRQHAYIPNSAHLGDKPWILCDELGNPVPAPWEGEQKAPVNWRAHAEALAELLTIARCPDASCDNNGTTVHETVSTTIGCCGIYLSDGQCCGNGVPEAVQDIEPAPCQWCHERTKALAAYEAEAAQATNPAEQQPDVSALVEALEAALMVMTSKEVRLEKQADAITMARAALAAHRKQGGDI